MRIEVRVSPVAAAFVRRYLVNRTSVLLVLLLTSCALPTVGAECRQQSSGWAYLRCAVPFWCCDDHCRKPLPRFACLPDFVCPDYCGKPCPKLCSPRDFGCDDYCWKPLPKLCWRPVAAEHSCGGNSCCASCGKPMTKNIPPEKAWVSRAQPSVQRR